MIQFRPLDKAKKPGEGRNLLLQARKASAAMPALLKIGQDLELEEVNQTTEYLMGLLPDADIRILEGISIPLCIGRKVITQDWCFRSN